MSRSYRMQLEISPVKEGEYEKLKELADSFFEQIEGDLDVGSYLSFWGDLTLGGGTTPEEKHAEIKEAFKELKKKVNTRWLCWDNHPWDEEFEGFKEGG